MDFNDENKQEDITKDEVILVDQKENNGEEEKVEVQTSPEVSEPVIVNKGAGKMALAILLSAVYGLGGCIVWAIVFNLGFVSGWIACLTVFLAALGYKKIRGTLDKIGIAVSVIVTLIEVILTVLICYAIFVFDAGLAANIFDGIKVLFQILREYEEIRASFTSDVVLSVVFTVIGVVIYIFNRNRPKLEINKKDSVK